jgi:hypothetical protein
MQWKTTSNKKWQKLKIVFKPLHKTLKSQQPHSLKEPCKPLSPEHTDLCQRDGSTPSPQDQWVCDLVKYEHEVYGFITNATLMYNILLVIQIFLLKNVTALYNFIIYMEGSVIQLLLQSYDSVFRHACTLHNPLYSKPSLIQINLEGDHPD